MRIHLTTFMLAAALGCGGSDQPAATPTSTSAVRTDSPSPTTTAVTSTPTPASTGDAMEAAPPGDADVEKGVRSAIKSDAKGSFGAQNLAVTVTAGRATLKGAVASEAEHARILAAARAVNGVKTIDDQIVIAK
ncbi:hypothetical protein BH09MYX1_BH09MYX1_00170 [soil metagenome]